MFLKFFMVSLVVLFSTSCGSSKKVEKTKKEVNIRKEIKTDKPKEIDKIYFFNNKRYPFTSKYSQVIETAILNKNNTKTIHSKEYDFNSDGVIDMLMLFDKGELVKIISDLDFDNNYDVIDYYKNKNLVERQIINHINKKPYIWIYYNDKKIIRKEMDTTLDGKVNQLFLYQNSILTEKRFDTNGSGKFDKIKFFKKKIKQEDKGDK